MTIHTCPQFRPGQPQNRTSSGTVTSDAAAFVAHTVFTASVQTTAAANHAHPRAISSVLALNISPCSLHGECMRQR